MIDYNLELLNRNALGRSFFHLDRNDPTVGFSYDASKFLGHTYPAQAARPISPPSSTPTSPHTIDADTLCIRLLLGSHLAQHLRHQLDEQKGYTSTVGISTTKLVAKLVGNVNKPRGQTTLLPPYESTDENDSNVASFMDAHDIGKVPGIGFKLAQKIRQHVLQRQPADDGGLVFGGTKEKVLVRDLRLFPGMGAEVLESLLGGAGAPRGIGAKIWALINGVDDTEVEKARVVPRQISIEDSYIRLDTLDEVKKELKMLAESLIKRMQLDLTEEDTDDLVRPNDADSLTEALRVKRRWLAHPRTLRLSTRPRPPRHPDGSRARCFNRISLSGHMPTFVFNMTKSAEVLADKLVSEALIPTFRKLHPEKSGWDLSLVNVAATNMAETATDERDGTGRHIGRMFQRQESVLKGWRIEDKDTEPSDDEAKKDEKFRAEDTPEPFDCPTKHEGSSKIPHDRSGSEHLIQANQESNVHDGLWDSEEADSDSGDTCHVCGAIMPIFAMAAHLRFHTLPD